MPNFNINIQIMNFGAEFERRLWLHTVNPKRDVTSTKCETFQTMFMPELRLIRNILRLFFVSSIWAGRIPKSSNFIG